MTRESLVDPRPFLTDKQIFDRVVGFVVAQGKPAIGGDGNCCYLSPTGERCAAGCLLRNDAKTNALALQMKGDVQHTWGGGSFAAMTDFQFRGKQLLIVRWLQKSHDQAAKIAKESSGANFVDYFLDLASKGCGSFKKWVAQEVGA